MTVYISIDGDNIGDKIATGYLENDEKKLQEINRELNRVILEISQHLQLLGFENIFVAADGVVCKGDYLQSEDFIQFIQQVGKPYFTFSVGVGNSLRGAFFALKYAKALGKNKLVAETESGDFDIVS